MPKELLILRFTFVIGYLSGLVGEEQNQKTSHRHSHGPCHFKRSGPATQMKKEIIRNSEGWWHSRAMPEQLCNLHSRSAFCISGCIPVVQSCRSRHFWINSIAVSSYFCVKRVPRIMYFFKLPRGKEICKMGSPTAPKISCCLRVSQCDTDKS